MQKINIKRFNRFSLTAMAVCLLLLPALLKAQPRPVHRKKVGVVLSGGGAKGMAHIGALKVIEKAGIPIDYVVGTSMGSIIGGLYSIGYSPEQLDSMVRRQDWTFLLSDKIPRSEQNLSERDASQKYVFSIPFGKGVKAEIITIPSILINCLFLLPVFPKILSMVMRSISMEVYWLLPCVLVWLSPEYSLLSDWTAWCW